MDWFETMKWVAGVIAAIVGAGLVIKLTYSRKSSNDSSIRVVSQKGNHAGGDIIAGDSVKKTEK
jgi:cell division septal protein FtsQ